MGNGGILKMRQYAIIAASALGLILMFQNCGGPVAFEQDMTKLGSLGVCNGISCDLDPLTDKPAVTTILIALGDEAESQLVVSGASSQLIAETVIRYSSPKNNPKILLVRDSNTGSEDPEDTEFIRRLLSRYDVTFIQASSMGLTAEDLEGYDLIWFNNPGHPMANVESRDALMAFKGAVVLQGDDLARGGGAGFSMTDLTGLTFVDNGTSVTCDGKAWAIDNNTAEQYQVTLDVAKIPGADSNTIEFKYGNDIDNAVAARADLEVLAYAKGSPSTCTERRPAIVRWTK